MVPKQWARRLAGALLLALAPLLAWAQPYLSGPDAAAVREVIEAQLDAFKRDDAQRAFSYAAPGIRQMFGTAENFVRMVRASYPVVYRPRTVQFERFEVVDDEVFQPVRMTDAHGPGVARAVCDGAPAGRNLAHQRLPARATRRAGNLIFQADYNAPQDAARKARPQWPLSRSSRGRAARSESGIPLRRSPPSLRSY